MSDEAPPKRALWLLLLLPAAGLLWWALQAPERQAPAARDAAAPAVATRTDDAPRLDAGAVEPDAAAVTPPASVSGLLGGPPPTEPPSGWRAEGAVWISPDGTRLTLTTRQGRVTGARAEFPPDAYSAHLTGLSPLLLGHGGGAGAMLPVGLESLEPEREPRAGTLEIGDGRTFRWRAGLRTEGEPPFGPTWFELELTGRPADRPGVPARK